MHRGTVALFTALVVLAGASAAAAPRKPTQQQAAVIDYRQAQMKQLGGAMRTLGAFAKGDLADLGKARAAAATLTRAGASMPHLWPAGTAVGVGESNTRASLWKERDQFARRVAQFQAAARDLNGAAAGGQRTDVARRLGAVGASCKACHDEWQVKD